VALAFADLLAPITLPGPDDALATWRWRIGEDATPWLVTALGDVFLRAADGRITFLDTYVGQVEEAAAANTEWTSALQGPGNADKWFDPGLVAAIRARGLRLGPEQCYSPIEPFILGGKMEPGNFEVTEWRVHAGLLGQMYERMRNGGAAGSGGPISPHPDPRPTARWGRPRRRRRRPSAP
jgi:hypothetical protein